MEPNIQFLIEEIPVEALAEMGPYLSAGSGLQARREFALKPVIDFREKIDTTEVRKAPLFRPHGLLREPGNGFRIVKDDKPVTEKKPDVKELEKALKTKKAVDMRRRPVVKKKGTSASGWR